VVLRPVLRELKHGTADLHEEAERYVRILDGDANAVDYVRYLRTMYGYHAPIERALLAHEPLAAVHFDAPARCVKAAWMRADLRELGERDEPAVCTQVPAPSTLARALGIAYVLEGSTLGGRFIVSRLPPALARLPRRYLDGYGAETGPRWRAFGDIVARELRSPLDEASAVHAARETFSLLISWLAREGQRRAFAEAS
jgi:heme oxygenase